MSDEVETAGTGGKAARGRAARAEAAVEGAAHAPYSSVVYVHGMGSQRRYEETSRLVDRLDHYLGQRHRKGASLGLLSQIRTRVEPLRPDTGSNSIVGYIRTRYAASPGPGEPTRETRFYEAYWAPVMADVTSPWRVVKWLFSQPLRPVRTLGSCWRDRQRLRRSSLVSLFERGRKPPAAAGPGDYNRVVSAYGDFDGLEAQRRFPRGTFKDFLAFLELKFAGEPETIKRLQAVAHLWRGFYRREEIRNAVTLTTMALALALLAGAAAGGSLLILQSLAGLTWARDLLGAEPDWKMAAGVAVSFAGLIGAGRFLNDYLGDVEAWATYEETNAKHVARNKALDECMAIMTHVLTDPRCERVTVIAHSLGASVAHDALLALTRRNRARQPDDPITGPVPLGKIEHFVTMGSPIDKIEYFFESYASPSHRYKRVVEALRGDIGTEPFSRNGKPSIHWVNYWDEGDVISGALHSPASASPHRQWVDNVHVASFHFPAPGASHSAYFDHARVIGDLFDIVYRRAASFRTLTQPAPDQPYDYESASLGPGDRSGVRTGYLMTALATPWLAAASLAALLAGWTSGAWALWAVTGLAVFVLVAGYLVSKAAGHRASL